MNEWLTSMLGVVITTPFMLLTLLAILLPIIIHLLSKSSGELIKIAHTQLLQLPKQQPITHLNLQQRMLLLLRISILSVLSLILAELMMTKKDSLTNQSSQIAVSQSWLNAANGSQRDALANTMAGDPAILLSPHTRKINPEQVRQWSATTDLIAKQNLWEQIKHYLSQAESPAPLSVYATDSSLEFTGSKPPISSAVNWHILQSVDNVLPQQSIKIRLQADTDSVYLPYWQQALTLLQGTSPSNLSIDWALLQPDEKTDDIDWLVALPKARNQFTALDEVTQLNGSVDQPEFPLSLSQVIVQKLHLKSPHFFTLSAEQISEQISGHPETEERPKSAYSAANQDANSPLLSYLGMLLILLFCLERWLSEKQGVKTGINKQAEPA